MGKFFKKMLVMLVIVGLVLPAGFSNNTSFGDADIHHYPSCDLLFAGYIEINQIEGKIYIQSLTKDFKMQGGNINSYVVYDKNDKEIATTDIIHMDHVIFNLNINGNDIEERYEVVVVKQPAYIDFNDYFSSFANFGHGYGKVKVDTTFGQLMSTTKMRDGVKVQLRTDGEILEKFDDLLVQDHINDLYFIAPEYTFNVSLRMDYPFVTNDNRFIYNKDIQTLTVPYPMTIAEMNAIFMKWNKWVDEIYIIEGYDYFVVGSKDTLSTIEYVGGGKEYAFLKAGEAPALKGSKGVYGYDFIEKTAYVDVYAGKLTFSENELENTKLLNVDGDVIAEGNNSEVNEEIMRSVDKVIITMPGGYDLGFKPKFIELSPKPQLKEEEAAKEEETKVVAEATEEIIVLVEFSDLDKAWAKKEIGVLASKGIISGQGDGTFNPNGKLTRAAFAKMLIKSLNLATEETATYADITDTDWFKDIAVTAYAYGLTKDMESFKGNEELSRQEMAYMAAKALKYKEVETKSDFTDYAEIEEWAQSPVDFLVSKSLINGSKQEDGTFKFNPMNSLTRQESVKVIYNILGLE